MRPEYLLFACVGLGVTGQILLKYATIATGATQGAEGSFASTLLRLLKSPTTVALLGSGITCYVISMLLWLYVLSRRELSWAYPILASSYVLVVLASWLLFKDHVNLMRLAGLLLICAGVAIVFRS